MAAETVELQVEGMHCAGCVGRVERALTAVAGVTEARVNLAEGRAAVRLDRPAPAAELVAAVDRAGFRARPLTDQSPTAELDDLVESKKSLMPEGFEKQMTKDDLTNLLEFLTLKGKYVPVPLDKVATVVSTRGMFFDANGQAERLAFPDWKPKEFNGVPFHLVDPNGDTAKNVVMLNGPRGDKPPKMPMSWIDAICAVDRYGIWLGVSTLNS